MLVVRNVDGKVRLQIAQPTLSEISELFVAMSPLFHLHLNSCFHSSSRFLPLHRVFIFILII
jgi:hypothetical protein